SLRTVRGECRVCHRHCSAIAGDGAASTEPANPSVTARTAASRMALPWTAGAPGATLGEVSEKTAQQKGCGPAVTNRSPVRAASGPAVAAGEETPRKATASLYP